MEQKSRVLQIWGDNMKIERNTKVQKGSGVLTTSIPQTISEIMGIERGTPLVWTLTDEGKVTIQKEDLDE